MNNQDLKNKFEETKYIFADKLIKELGGSITYKSDSGSIYVTIDNGEVVRISDHKVICFDEFSKKHKYNISSRYDYNCVDTYFTNSEIETCINEIKEQLV
jgi:phenylalanyl-tRNA synthetase beta subunit